MTSLFDFALQSLGTAAGTCIDPDEGDDEGEDSESSASGALTWHEYQVAP